MFFPRAQVSFCSGDSEHPLLKMVEECGRSMVAEVNRAMQQVQLCDFNLGI